MDHKEEQTKLHVEEELEELIYTHLADGEEEYNLTWVLKMEEEIFAKRETSPRWETLPRWGRSACWWRGSNMDSRDSRWRTYWQWKHLHYSNIFYGDDY